MQSSSITGNREGVNHEVKSKIHLDNDASFIELLLLILLLLDNFFFFFIAGSNIVAVWFLLKM